MTYIGIILLLIGLVLYFLLAPSLGVILIVIGLILLIIGLVLGHTGRA